MHHALSMSLVQRVGDLDGVPQSLVERQGTFLQPVGQRLTLEVLHDQEVDPVLFTDVMERADVRMIQARDRTGLALEALLELGMVGEVSRKHFDGDGAIEPGVFGFVDFSHSARTDGGQSRTDRAVCRIRVPLFSSREPGNGKAFGRAFAFPLPNRKR